MANGLRGVRDIRNAEQTMKVGETLQLSPATIHIPIADPSALTQHWFVAEMVYKLTDRPRRVAGGQHVLPHSRQTILRAASSSVSGRGQNAMVRSKT